MQKILFSKVDVYLLVDYILKYKLYRYFNLNFSILTQVYSRI